MPALVKSKVGSSPGTSGDERTRVWPLRSKYCRNCSRSSAPVIGGLIVSPGSVLDPEADTLADDPRHHRHGIAAAQEMVAQARGRGCAIATLERRQTPMRDGARLLEIAVFVPAGQRRLDQLRVDSARPELRAQPGGPVAARRTRRDPVTREGVVVEVAASGEIGHDVVRNVGGRAAPPQTRGHVARGPRVPGKEVGGREPRGPRVESSARTARTRYDLLKKELPAGDTGALSVARCSNDCSPVEKMPRTLRSKSSALVAASRAVSYEMIPSR